MWTPPTDANRRPTDATGGCYAFTTNKRRRVILAVLLVAGFGLSTPAAYATTMTQGCDYRAWQGRHSDVTRSMIRPMWSRPGRGTKVKRTDGLRDITLNSAALMPGLRVEVEGVYLTSNRFAAERVSFSRADLKMAFAIQGGVDQTDQQSLENQRRIEQNVRTAGAAAAEPAAAGAGDSGQRDVPPRQ